MLAAQIPAIKPVIADGPTAAGALAYETVLAAAAPTLARRATAFDETCMQPYTSGSTGKPKGVLLTHGGQLLNSDIMRKALLADDTERALIAVPLYHKNAMVGAVKPFLLAGGSLEIHARYDTLQYIRAIDRYR